MSKFKRLVAYGCSFTQGGELVDEDWFPGAEEFKKSKGMSKFNDLTKTKLGNEGKLWEYLNDSKKFSWANILAEKMNLECSNLAVPGNSMLRLVYQIEKDLSESNITSEDLIVIGLTTPNRLCWLREINSSINPANMHLAWPDSFPKELKSGHEYFVTWFNLETSKFFQTILLSHLLRLANTTLSGRLYFVECYPFEGFRGMQDNHCEEYNRVIQRIFSEFKSSGLILSTYNLFEKTSLSDIHAGGHPMRHIHDRWAKHIYENCQKLGLT
jgi:hypothetical protein